MKEGLIVFILVAIIAVLAYSNQSSYEEGMYSFDPDSTFCFSTAPDSIYGKWKVFNYFEEELGYVSKRKAKKLIGKTIVLYPYIAVLHGSCIYNPIYNFTGRHNSEDYLWDEYRQDIPSDGIIKDTITVVELLEKGTTLSTSYFMADFFLVSRDTMVEDYFEEGVFLYLKRVE